MSTEFLVSCSMASMEVIQYSVADLYKGFALHENINIEATLIMYITLGVGTAFKLSLYFYCLRFANVSDSVAALAEDHLNDVASNLAAIVTASIAGHVKRLWYVDPIGNPLQITKNCSDTLWNSRQIGATFELQTVLKLSSSSDIISSWSSWYLMHNSNIHCCAHYIQSTASNLRQPNVVYWYEVDNLVQIGSKLLGLYIFWCIIIVQVLFLYPLSFCIDGLPSHGNKWAFQNLIWYLYYTVGLQKPLCSMHWSLDLLDAIPKYCWRELTSHFP